MATSKTVNLTMTYNDYTEKTYKIPWQNNADVVAKIKAFNGAAATADSSVSQTFLSVNGSPVTAITEATTITKTEEVIYSA